MFGMRQDSDTLSNLLWQNPKPEGLANTIALPISNPCQIIDTKCFWPPYGRSSKLWSLFGIPSITQPLIVSVIKKALCFWRPPACRLERD